MTFVCAAHPSEQAVARCVNCSVHLCPSCRVLDGVRNFCAHCQGALRGAAPVSHASAIEIPPPAVARPSPRSPALAAVLSLVPGLGQAYCGRLLRGAAFFAGAFALRQTPWLTPLLGAFLYVFNLFDAYRLAQNRSEERGRGQAPLRADDTVFLLVGMGVLAVTLLGHGGFLAAPAPALVPIALLGAALLVAHQTRR